MSRRSPVSGGHYWWRFGEFLFGEDGKIFEQLVIFGCERSWLLVENTEGAGFEAVHSERAACIEADFGIADDDGVVREARVFEGVLDIEDVIEEDSVGAEGDVAGGLADGESLHGLEPLAVGVDHADGHVGDVEDAAGQACEPIESFFARGVEDVEGVESGDSVGFVAGDGRCLHGSAPKGRGWTAQVLGG